MRPSPVRLEHYHLTSLSIEPIDGYKSDYSDGLYPKFSDANFQINIQVGEPGQDDDSEEFLIHLELKAQPKEDRPFPYLFNIGGDAIISYQGKEESQEVVRDLIAVNGVSMLYSALREVLFSLTFRFPNGPMMLPSASFLDLRKTISEQRRVAQVQTTVATQQLDQEKPKRRLKIRKKEA